jgi:transposase-like protein
MSQEVKRRINVVGVFPDVAAVIRLLGAVLQEIDDEWQAGKRYFSLEPMRKLYETDALTAPVTTSLRYPPAIAPVH